MRDLLNALAKSPQNDDLRFSSGLFLSGLKIDKLDGIEVNREKCIVNRRRQFPHVPRFVSEELVERTQESHVVDPEVCASPLCHDSYRLGTGLPQLNNAAVLYMRYIHDTQELFKSRLKFAGNVGRFEEDILVYPDIEEIADRDFHRGLDAQILARNLRAQLPELLAKGAGCRLTSGRSREQ